MSPLYNFSDLPSNSASTSNSNSTPISPSSVRVLYSPIPPTSIPTQRPTSKASTMNAPVSTFIESNSALRPSKRRRASTSMSEINVSDEPNTNTSANTTSRPRRQAALKSREQFQSQFSLKSQSPSQSPSYASRTATARKTKASASSKSNNAEVPDEGSDGEEKFECPCALGCESIRECEGAKKEAVIRDVGMSIVVTSKSIVKIIVGTIPNQESFLVHRELLALHSDYFAALFARPSQQSLDATTTAGSRLRMAPEEAFTGAMRGAHLGAIATTKENAMAGVKMELDDDSDDDFAMISSDQYYTALSQKKLMTPKTTPVKKSQFMSTVTPTSSFRTNKLTTLLSKSPLTTPAKAHTQPHPQQEIYHLPIIQPLPFALFKSYMYTGVLTLTLLTVSDKRESCTWECLWALGYRLQSPGFVNYCMDGLMSLNRVQEGSWPTNKEAKIVWDLKLDGRIGSNDEAGMRSEGLLTSERLRCDEELRSRSTSTSTLKSPATNHSMSQAPRNGKPKDSPVQELANNGHGENTPLHLFTAACIAHNSPLTRNPAESQLYRFWSRLLSDPSKASLSLAVLSVDVNRFCNKGPWDDEFRGEWKVAEVELTEKLRRVVEERSTGCMGVKDGRGEMAMAEGARRGLVGCLLEGLVLKGEGWVGEMGEQSDGSESEGGKSEDGEFENDDECEEDRDELWGGRRRRR